MITEPQKAGAGCSRRAKGFEMNYNPKIAAFLQQAMQAQRGGDLAGAEAACREALKIDARNPDALQFLGLVCRHSGRLGEGEKLMRLSLEINPA